MARLAESCDGDDCHRASQYQQQRQQQLTSRKRSKSRASQARKESKRRKRQEVDTCINELVVSSCALPHVCDTRHHNVECYAQCGPRIYEAVIPFNPVSLTVIVYSSIYYVCAWERYTLTCIHHSPWILYLMSWFRIKATQDS